MPLINHLAYLEHHHEFEKRLQPLLDPLENSAKQLIFINDGARWIRDFISTYYAKAIQIIDYYHVREHICTFAQGAISDKERPDWIENTSQMLLESKLDDVLEEIINCKVSTKKRNF